MFLNKKKQSDCVQVVFFCNNFKKGADKSKTMRYNRIIKGNFDILS